MFKHTPYEHHHQRTAESLPMLTVEDVKQFYAENYNRSTVVFALAGDYPASLAERLQADVARLESGKPKAPVELSVAPIEGRRVVLIEKPGGPTSISFGVPIDVRRGSREFYALAIANAWLGQHRKGFGRRFNSIRAQRGLNYGNYSYIEAFRWRPYRVLPHNGLGRQQQRLEVRLRSLPRKYAVFALTLAMREVERLSTEGMTESQFDDAIKTVSRYSRFFATTDKQRLGSAVDDVYYDLAPGHLELLRQMTNELTLDEVNAALAEHFRVTDLVIAIVTDDSNALKEALVDAAPGSIDYEQTVSDSIQEEDIEIAKYPLALTEENISKILPADVFRRRAPD